MRALITRPEYDSNATAEELRSRGIDCVIAPLLFIENKKPEISLSGVQALVFTSANGVRAFAEASPERGLPVFCVGAASARSAREAGFGNVESANGDVAALAGLVGEKLEPESGALLHIAGQTVAGDLQGSLQKKGFLVARTVLYEALLVNSLPDNAKTALTQGALEAALFFSPRTADAFVRLVLEASLGPACGKLRAYALSEAVARALGGLPWRGIRTATRPEADSLFALLEEDRV